MSEASETVGQRLKAERERKGLSTQRVADELHLDGWVVEALESGDYERIGPAVYAKGHLKRYAANLGLPADELSKDFSPIAGPVVPPQPAGMRMRTSAPAGSDLPWPQIVGFAGVAVAVIGILLWHPWHLRNAATAPGAVDGPISGAASAAGADSEPAAGGNEQTVGDGPTVATGGAPSAGDGLLGSDALSGSARPSIPAAAVFGSRPGTGVGVATGVGAPAAGGPAGARPAAGGAPLVGAAMLGAAAAGAAKPAAAGAAGVATAVAGAAVGTAKPDAAGAGPVVANSAAAGRAKLRMSFSEDSWVDIHDAAGLRIYAGTGHANSVRTISGAAPLHVYLKSASGVQLEVNNRAVAIGRQYVAGNAAHFEAGADGVLRRDPLAATAGTPTHAAPTRSPRPRG